jgi:hypothetical protein
LLRESAGLDKVDGKVLKAKRNFAFAARGILETAATESWGGDLKAW